MDIVFVGMRCLVGGIEGCLVGGAPGSVDAALPYTLNPCSIRCSLVRAPICAAFLPTRMRLEGHRNGNRPPGAQKSKPPGDGENRPAGAEAAGTQSERFDRVFVGMCGVCVEPCWPHVWCLVGSTCGALLTAVHLMRGPPWGRGPCAPGPHQAYRRSAAAAGRSAAGSAPPPPAERRRAAARRARRRPAGGGRRGGGGGVRGGGQLPLRRGACT